ncbi:anion permease [uncultured Mitsuokella sp.]|uniref:anion permease n=1 Tax=uncultured Mitsuokella sp. TaxID=453120 RepID=UPI0025F1361D|nr:anion permease [uncultured Mitsuokella sp.]
MSSPCCATSAALRRRLSRAWFRRTNATGAAPILYGAGYVPQGKWWQLGFIMVTVYMVIWLGIGSFWWHVIGLW